MRLLLQEDVVLPSSSFRRRLAIVLPLLRHDLAGSAHRHRHGTAMCRICVAYPSLVQACGVCFDACRSVQMGCTPIDAAGLVSDFRGHTKAKHPACRGCLGSWVSACLDEGRHEVLCPNAECSMCLTDTQLTEYTSSAHQPRVCEQQRESLLDRRRDAGMARLLQMVGHGWCFRRLSPQPL